MPLVLTENKSV